METKSFVYVRKDPCASDADSLGEEIEAYFESLLSVVREASGGADEWFAGFRAEDTFFLRFNDSVIRQPGTRVQASLSIDLVDDKRGFGSEVALSGKLGPDSDAVRDLVGHVRAGLRDQPVTCDAEFARDGERWSQRDPDRLPKPETVVQAISAAALGQSLSGVYTAGSVHRGFANAGGGQRWLTRHLFDIDWVSSVADGRAVKGALCGASWEGDRFDAEVHRLRRTAEILSRPPHHVVAGSVRCLLSPSAVRSIVELAVDTGLPAAAYSPDVHLAEIGTGSVAPDFDDRGHRRPDEIVLVHDGRARDTLADQAVALELRPGSLSDADTLAALGTGLWIGDVGYLAASGPKRGAFEASTRFATVWVEDGKPMAPVEPVRLRWSIADLLGEELIGLTTDRVLFIAPDTYVSRPLASTRVPGAVVRGLDVC